VALPWGSYRDITASGSAPSGPQSARQAYLHPEVQTGVYFEENDIVRYEDIYARL
jgi:hypothetical protein